MSEVRDITLAASGEKKIRWARRNMPLLRGLEEQFIKERPFEGIKIALSVHMEAKTAYLCRVLQSGGAQMHATGCNPLSTQDDVAAALASGGIDTHAWHGSTPEEYHRHLSAVLEPGVNIVIDDGGDLVSLLHGQLSHKARNVIGGCEETTTGIHRLRAMHRRGELKFPMIMVNEADCKHFFDNRYGTGQSVWDGIMRTTNLIVAGKHVVVSGYGWCGKGVSMRAKGLGARIIITEIDPVRALEAHMDGYDVMPMSDACAVGDVFITTTGCRDIIERTHFEKMRDGAILCNAGHFNLEINLNDLANLAARRYEARKNIEGYVMPDGRELFVLAEGRLVNIAAGDGHPVEIMDMSFAIQALSAKYLIDNKYELQPGVIAVPRETDEAVARRKLAATGIAIDTLTSAQREYLGS